MGALANPQKNIIKKRNITWVTPARVSGIIHESLRNVHESYSWIGSWNVHEDPMNLQTGHHDDWNFIHENKVQEYSWKAGYSWTNFATEKAFFKIMQNTWTLKNKHGYKWSLTFMNVLED